MELASRKVAIYVRVSSEEQRHDLQVTELEEYARRKDWTILRKFEDTASGASPNRKMLGELMQECRAHRINTVLIWKLDRLYRSMKHAVTAISELQGLGVDVVSIKENLDLTEPTGRLMAHVLMAFAEWELSTIRMRVRSGMAAARARGVQIGRRSVISPTIIQEVYRLTDSGLSIRAVERQMNKRISRTTVERILKMRRR